MDTQQYWFNFFWLVAYFLVLIGMSGYGFPRLMMVILYDGMKLSELAVLLLSSVLVIILNYIFGKLLVFRKR